MSSEHGSHWLEREDLGGVTVVRLKPARVVDDDTTRAVFDPIYGLVAAVGRNNLALNLGAAEYLSSLALGKLVVLNRKVQAGNGRLALCQVSPAVESSLESTHLKPLFNIYATEQEAVQSFS
jgi:anti-sigma B factor antagonist